MSKYRMFTCPCCSEKVQGQDQGEADHVMSGPALNKLIAQCKELFHEYGITLPTHDPMDHLMRGMLVKDILPFDGFGAKVMYPTPPAVPEINLTADQLDDMTRKLAILVREAGVQWKYRESLRNMRGAIVEVLTRLGVKNLPEQRHAHFDLPSVLFGDYKGP